MIIWRGWGLLVPIIFIVLFIFVPEIFKSRMSPESYIEYFNDINAFSLLLTAGITWFIGRKLNRGEVRTLIDEKTGEKVLFRKKHSFFFINVEYWAIPLIIFSVFVGFSEN